MGNVPLQNVSKSLWGLTSDTFLKMDFLQAIAEIVVYHLTAFNASSSLAIITRLERTVVLQNCFKLRRNDSFRAVCDGIFSSLKCQVSSFHPALCLLSFTERTVCLENVFARPTQLFLFQPALQCCPTCNDILQMLCAAKTGFTLLWVEYLN